MPKFPLRIQFDYIYILFYILLISAWSFPMCSMIARGKFLLFMSFSERKKTFLWKIKSRHFIQPITCSVLPLQFLLNNLAHLQSLLASDTILIDRPWMLMDFSLPYAVKLNSIPKSIRKADKYQLHKKNRPEQPQGVKRWQRFVIR